MRITCASPWHMQRRHQGHTCFAGVAVNILEKLGASGEAALLPLAGAAAAARPLRLVRCRHIAVLPGGRAPAQAGQAAQLLLQPAGVQRRLQQAGAAARQASTLRAADAHGLHPWARLLQLQPLQSRRLALQHICHSSGKRLLHRVGAAAARLALARLCCRRVPAAAAARVSRHKVLQLLPHLAGCHQLAQQAGDAAARQRLRCAQQGLQAQQRGGHALQRQQGVPRQPRFL